MAEVSHGIPMIAGGVRRTEARRPLALGGSMLLTVATILLYAITIGFLVYASVNDVGGGIFADTPFLGR